jgi:hypothetical protein
LDFPFNISDHHRLWITKMAENKIVDKEDAVGWMDGWMDG